MFTIKEKAYKTAKEKSSDFVVKSVTAASCCSGTIRSISIELIKDFNDTEYYKCYEYNGIKAYIHKSLEIGENVVINQSAKIPLLGTFFQIDGVKVQNFM